MTKRPTSKIPSQPSPNHPGAGAFYEQNGDFQENSFAGKNDEYTWNAFKSGNESAFVYMYSKFFPDLVNYGHQFTADKQLVEDSIQDLFIHLRNNRNRLTAKMISIKSYLYIALKRRIIEYRRHAVRGMECGIDFTKGDFALVPSIEETLVQSQEQHMQHSLLQSALSRLTSHQREVLYYFFYENLSYNEIQEIMQFGSVKSVRNLIYKSVNILKALLKVLLVFVAFR